MTPCVYLICNLLNGKVYVGKTNNAGHRWAQHVSASRGKRHHMPIVRAIKKYGAENFTFEVLERFNTEEAALEAECRWISHYESNNPAKGYNLDGGGLGGKTLSAETRRKLSEALRGRKLSPEHVAKMSSARKGRALSTETRARMSAARLGKKRDPAIGRKVSEALRGRPLTVETKAKMSVVHQGRKLAPDHITKVAIANTGKKRSDEARAKMSLAMKESRRQNPRRMSPETKAKIAASLRRHHAQDSSKNTVVVVSPEVTVVTVKDNSGVAASTVDDLLKKYGG